MKLYELGNPSDPYTYYASSDLVAIATNLYLGQGKTFCIDTESGEQLGPMLLFASEQQVEAALKETFGEESLGGFMKQHRAEIADALDSLMIFNAKKRRDYEDALVHITDPNEREAYREKVLNRHRSSLNNYAAWAWGQAKSIREQLAKEAAGAEAGSTAATP